MTYGNKFWIASVRREVLVNCHFLVGIRVTQELGDRIIAGLEGKLEDNRYGLPFAGDNNFLFDDIQVVAKPPLACWYCPITVNTPLNHGICRLTTWIDRADNTPNSNPGILPHRL